jgi:hypothetical protein
VIVFTPSRLRSAALAALLLLAACGPKPTGAVLTPTPPAATPFLTTQPATPLPSGDPPNLASFAWGDRSPFRAGLVASQQPVLAGLPGAPVYHIAITVTQSLDAVQGHEEMQYTNRTGGPLSEIVFHLFPNLLAGSLAASNVLVDGASVNPTLDQRGTILRVPLRQPLAPNGHTAIGMDFDVSVPHDLGRNYGVLAFNQDILALSHFFPLVAVFDQRGWNVEIPAPIGDLTYAEAAFYLVQVRAPIAPVIAGSGNVISRQTNGGDQVLTFEAGPARDFYLSLSPDYIVVSDKMGEITVNSYAPSGHEVEARAALQVAEAALADYGARYGPYPYTELDVVATSTLALGIEYPGIIAITLRVYDPNANFGGTPVSVEREVVVAHEVGHQWFYNMVGNDQLDEPWLDESLVQYITWQYYAHQHGQAAGDGFRASLQARAQSGDKPNMPLGLPVSAYTGGEYSAIIYGRGPLFFDALDQKMGQANMDAFLADYSRTFQWKFATTAGLEQLAEQHCGCDLSALFKQWIMPN